MAVYEYECASCGRRFEHRRGMTDDRPDPDCPSCGAARARRVFSVFATGVGTPSAGGGGCACGGACACGAHG